MKKRLLSILLTACLLVGLLPTVALAEEWQRPGSNQAIFTINFEEDGSTDNVIAAWYNGIYYVMGKPNEDGSRQAVPAARVAEGAAGNGEPFIIDTTQVELLKVEGSRVYVSNGSIWVDTLKTAAGSYIADNGVSLAADSTRQFGLAAAEEDGTILAKCKWRFDSSIGLYNYDTSWRIYLFPNNDSPYFALGSADAPDGTTCIKVQRFSMGCQHPNMEYVPAVEPTCKKDGNAEYWYCPDCGAQNHGAYFLAADALRAEFNPPIRMSTGAVDIDGNGVCDSCGKNMPVYKKVTALSQIVAGGKYLLVTKSGETLYAMSAPVKVEKGSEDAAGGLPSVPVTAQADGTIPFQNATDAMTFELHFAHGATEWGADKGIRYGIVANVDGQRMEYAPYNGGMLDSYEQQGAKYGYYVGLDGEEAKIYSAYDDSKLLHPYNGDSSPVFTISTTAMDLPVYLYRLTDVGKVSDTSYEMQAVKSETDYTGYTSGAVDAAGGTNVTGLTDALKQAAVDGLVEQFVTDCGEADSVQIATSVNVEVIGYQENQSVTFDLTPTATVTGSTQSQTYTIPDSSLDGTPMNVTVYTAGIAPQQIVHTKQNGTKEYFYPENSGQGEQTFTTFTDKDENQYASFDVTEYSNVQLFQVIPETAPITITFDANGGTVSTEKADCGADGKLASLPTPTRSGYIFDGWFTAVTGGDRVTVDTVFNGNTTIYAHWTAVSSGGGSSGGGSSSSSSTTTKNPDGSTTTTTTDKATGTVTETTKNTDGSTTTVETKKDGTVTETVKTADGTSGTVVTDSSGNVTEVKASVSATAAKEAGKTGGAVTLPVEVPAAKSTGDAPAVEITLSKSSGSAKVEIPVEKTTPGTVAVIVKADGTEEIVSTSRVTENGVALKLTGSTTVKVFDNAKSFTDVSPSNVFYNEVCSLSAREIMVGKSGAKFDLYSSVTLNQLSNVAGRITGAVDVKDYSGGIAWGQANGLKTGNESATRGDMLSALYTAAGSPAVEDTSSLSKLNDASAIPDDMKTVAAWALQNGILKGTADGKADLSANVTRGQACALAGRTLKTLG